MSLLRHELGAQVHQPGGRHISLVDRLGAKLLASTAEQIAMCRSLAGELAEDDVVFANGEDVGFPLALALSRRAPGRSPLLVIQVINPRGGRNRLALKIPGVANAVGIFVATTPAKVDFVREQTGLPASRFHAMHELTDTQFFTPGPSSPTKKRRIVGSCGLEQRDYVTLAEAAKHLDVDIRICAASPNANSKRSDFPEVPPANMVAKHYDWPELVQLYRDSDVVAVPVRPNPFQAGQTTLMEAMACERPVVVTQALGMVEDFARASLVRAVPERDAAALRRAIEDLLSNPEEAAAQARRGRERILEEYDTDTYVSELAGLLRTGGQVA